jgi:hypothetical protein
MSIASCNLPQRYYIYQNSKFRTHVTKLLRVDVSTFTDPYLIRDPFNYRQSLPMDVLKVHMECAVKRSLQRKTKVALENN